MATASLPVSSRTLPWQAVLAVVAAVIVVIATFTFMFGVSTSSSGSTKITNTSIDSDLLRCKPGQPC